MWSYTIYFLFLLFATFFKTSSYDHHHSLISERASVDYGKSMHFHITINIYCNSSEF